MRLQNGRMLSSEFEVTQSREDSRELNPDYTARALLREACENALAMGTPIREALIRKVGMESWLVDIAKIVSYSNLEIWAKYLREGNVWLSHDRGVNLAQIEQLLYLKRFIMEELQMQGSVNDTKLLQYKSTVETAIGRKSFRPQKVRGDYLSPEKGGWEAPEYDGHDPDNDLQSNLWVIPIRLCLWPNRQEIMPISKILDKYSEWMRGLSNLRRTGASTDALSSLVQHYPDPPLNLRSLKYEVKDWIRRWRPTIAEELSLPNAYDREQIDNWKMREIINMLTLADTSEFDNNALREFRKMARSYLGAQWSVSIPRQNIIQRIEAQIRRRFNKKKYVTKGRAWLPPIAAGEMLAPQIDSYVKNILSKNDDLDSRLPWVIEVAFDGQLREHRDGKMIVAAGYERMLQQHMESK